MADPDIQVELVKVRNTLLDALVPAQPDMDPADIAIVSLSDGDAIGAAIEIRMGLFSLIEYRLVKQALTGIGWKLDSWVVDGLRNRPRPTVRVKVYLRISQQKEGQK